MPQLLLELFSEEIPARMQAQAARDLERMAREKLAAEGLLPEGLKTFAGARRLTLVGDGLPPAQKDRSEEVKGPRANAPEQALEGFLRKNGLTRDQLVEKDGVWFATLDRPGRPTPEIVAEMVEAIVRGFPWPKSMTSGVTKLRWVRPLQRILCVFDGQVVPFHVEGIPATDLTEGHRFMGSGQAFRVKGFDDYAAGLAKNYVVLDPKERKARILADARTLCQARNLELVEDQGLLDEVAGLVEWPVPVMGDMDPAFLDLPSEVIRTSMRVHQRYFAVRDPATGKLAPHFVTVANIAARDGGATIARGNAKVLSARLSDARFFWEEDRKVRLEDRLEKLKGVTFHAKLGTMYERVERIAALAGELAPYVRDDEATRTKAVQAARLCKADLASGVVGEFPELQGVMGGYYAEHEGLDPEVADAIRSHYKPQGPNDDVPVEAVAATVALADKLDTLVGFFAIGEEPTGSRDPFGLRRAALGVIRIILQTKARLPLREIAAAAYQIRADREIRETVALSTARFREEVQLGKSRLREMDLLERQDWTDFRELIDFDEEVPTGDEARVEKAARKLAESIAGHLWRIDHRPTIMYLQQAIPDFFAARLKVQLREEGQRHDLVDAVFALGDDDLVRIVLRVKALADFLGTEDGTNLLAGYKRAVNILKAEEKKGSMPVGEPDIMDSSPPEERELIAQVHGVAIDLGEVLELEEFERAMSMLARLRAPVDAFFDKVLVNSTVAEERDNRLRLLAKVRDAMGRVADFSLVTG